MAMSQWRVAMDRIQELLRLHRMGAGCREVARLLRMGPVQERVYREALKKAGLFDGNPEDLPSLETLKAAVIEYRPPKPAPQQASSVERWTDQVKKMLERKAEPTAIFDALRLDEKEFQGSLWAVKRLCARLKRAMPPRAEDVAIPVVTAPGEVAQVDFGYVGKLYDPERGQLRRAWVFIMVLGFSRHMFARVVFDQRQETWLELHALAFEHFGGSVETLVPDNLRAAVVRAAFGVSKQPELNKSYRELARHYGIKIDPTPPYQPEKKGKVESAVKYIKHNFFKPRSFSDIQDCNRQLFEWVMKIAGMRVHGTTREQPLVNFERQERAALRPLPARRFELVVWAKVRVRIDCLFHFERHFYPVPWRFMDKPIWVRATPRRLEVFCEDVLVITHDRGRPVPREVLDQCLPEHRADLRYRSRRHWEKQADLLGQETGALIREVFDSDDELSLLRTVQAMVRLLAKHPERAEGASHRARFYASYTYTALRDMLRKGLDLQPLPTAMLPMHGTLPMPRYARQVSELMQLPLELSHEPN
jgi:transposase